MRHQQNETTPETLRVENTTFSGTNGVSQNNHDTGLAPGFLNQCSGEAVRASFADGRPAPIHTLDGLPDDWVVERDIQGHVVRVIAGVLAGFLYQGLFLTRAEATAFNRDDDRL